jgi:hypothetical protein
MRANVNSESPGATEEAVVAYVEVHFLHLHGTEKITETMVRMPGECRESKPESTNMRYVQ